MKKLALIVVFSTAAIAGGGVMFFTGGSRIELTNCSSSGSSSQALASGDYVMRVTDKDTWLCHASTCVGDAGEKWPMGTILALTVGRTVGVSSDGGVAFFPLADGGAGTTAAGGQVDGGYGQDFSCRSSDSTGDVIITEVRR
jgi:hypothetical protein